MTWNGTGSTLSHAQVFIGNVLQILSAIFDDSELQRHAYLRSCQSNPRCIAHRFFHVGDEFLSRPAAKLVDSQLPCALPQNRIADLNNFQLQVVCNSSRQNSAGCVDRARTHELRSPSDLRGELRSRSLSARIARCRIAALECGYRRLPVFV